MSLIDRLKQKFGIAPADSGRAPIRIFLLEDDERRCAWFEKRFKGDRLDISCDIAEAKELLESNTYDSIFLDHDLTAADSLLLTDAAALECDRQETRLNSTDGIISKLSLRQSIM
ncbi:MAG: hypothetical protein DMF73_02235 [Acidobacteria bacterium]|nr:MAG: hypothetical protein DMF73_02235 [Acidobacteriota bacterium]